MSDKLQRIVRAFLQGAVSAAVILAGNEQFDIANLGDRDWLKTALAAVIAGGVTAVVSAIHNFILDPSPIPSLAPKTTSEVVS